MRRIISFLHVLLELKQQSKLSVIADRTTKTMPQTVKSKRDKEQIVFEGNVFKEYKTYKNRRYWRCTEARHGTCPVRGISGPNGVNFMLSDDDVDHDHSPEELQIAYKEFMGNAKSMMAENPSVPRREVSNY